jgi:hypothetical protein
MTSVSDPHPFHRIRIQPKISMRIRIQGANGMRIHENLDLGFPICFGEINS